MRLNTQAAFWVVLALLAACLPAGGQIRPDVTQPPSKPAPKTAAPKPTTPKPTQIVIQTSPEAQVYLDDVFKGQASPQGRLVIENPTSGDHTLRVALTGKQNFEQQVTVATGQVAKVTAVLADLPKPEVPKPEAAPASVVIETSPGAQIYLDDTFKGQASPQGRLVIENSKPGDHSLRVTLSGKKDYQEQVAVTAGQTTNVRAEMVDLTGSIRVKTSPGAEVFLDDSSRGSSDANGQLVINDVAPGTHEIRITSPGKKEIRQSLAVAVGPVNMIVGYLTEITAPNPQGLSRDQIVGLLRGEVPAEGGVGTVYLIFDQKFLGHIPVYCDGTLLAEFVGHRYFAARITPGRHLFKLKWGGTIALDIAAGDSYYLRLIKDDNVELVPEEAGRALIVKNRPLDAVEFKDPRAFVPSF